MAPPGTRTGVLSNDVIIRIDNLKIGFTIFGYLLTLYSLKYTLLYVHHSFSDFYLVELMLDAPKIIILNLCTMYSSQLYGYFCASL